MSFQKLRCLNISKSLFFGEIPQQLGNRSMLRAPDLHCVPFSSHLYSKSLSCLTDPKRLQYLDTCGIKLARAASDWQQVSLPRLSPIAPLCIAAPNFRMSQRLSSKQIIKCSINAPKSPSVVKNFATRSGGGNSDGRHNKKRAGNSDIVSRSTNGTDNSDNSSDDDHHDDNDGINQGSPVGGDRHAWQP